MRKFNRIFSLALVGVMATLALSTCSMLGGKKSVEQDFTFAGFDGKDHLVSEYAGKPLVVNFWADWCPPCVGEFPHFQEVYNEKKGQFNLVSVAVSSSQDPKGFVNTNGYNWTFGQDTENAGAQLHQIEAIPATYFYDKSGHLVDSFVGGMEKADFEERLAKILQ